MRTQNVLTATALAAVFMTVSACSSVATVRLQPETVHVAPGLRPIAGIQANAISAYLLFIPIPGGVDLDNVVNRKLIVTAKTMGADKIADLRFRITPPDGFWALFKLIGWRTARASGIAVQVTDVPEDPGADQGPEPQPPAATPAMPAAPSPG